MFNGKFHYKWSFSIAMSNYRWPIEIDGLPINSMGGCFHGYVSHNQMVYPKGNSVGKSGSLPRPSLGGLPHLEVLILSLRDRWETQRPHKNIQTLSIKYLLISKISFFGVLVKVFPWVFAMFMPVLKLIGALDVIPTLVRFHGATKCRNEVPIPEVSQPTAWQPGKSQVLHADQAPGPGLQRVCTLDTLALEVRRNHLDPADHMVIMAWSIWMTWKVETSDLISKYLWGQTCQVGQWFPYPSNLLLGKPPFKMVLQWRAFPLRIPAEMCQFCDTCFEHSFHQKSHQKSLFQWEFQDPKKEVC